MSATLASDALELQRLYERIKSLTLAVSAALMLEQPLEELDAQVERLREECRAAAHGGAAGPAHGACIVAADDLAALIRSSADGGAATAQLARARASHRLLRREIWDVQPCEYVPCCVSDAHRHREERDG